MAYATPEAQYRYNHSAKGKARTAKYLRSEKHLEAARRYRASPRGRLVKYLYDISPGPRMRNRLRMQLARG